jgi:nucleotide-binding universal stress UspA family protein
MSGGLRRPVDWDEPVRLPAIPPVRRILVPFDGSHNAERALAWAALVAGRDGSEVIVLVAFDPPLTVKGRTAAYVDEMKTTLEEEARELAEESVALLGESGVSARGIVVKGDVAGGILQTAEDESAELIVLGRQGVSHEARDSIERFRTLLSGGIAEKVSRHAAVPVLIVV